VIDDAVEVTKPLEAKKRRTLYVGERSIGYIDSSASLFKAMLESEGISIVSLVY
jgi:hypothetical protein